MKFLVWAALGAIVVMWLLRAKSSGRRTGADASGAAAQSGGESMIRCTYCGTHVPQSEVVVNQAGNPFCSEDHRLGHAAH